MIGNAHIDPVWLWDLAEGRDEVLATYRSALDRMDETPGFIFSSGGAVTYRWVQEDDPAAFAAIQQRVAEGRWALVNGWWIQPDCNIPCGESFVRHGLYGQRALQELFGQRTVTGYNVDSFGHAGSLPQILRGCGLNHYVFFRPAPPDKDHPGEKDLPGTLFWWESDDGSRVLASRPPLHYPSQPGDLRERIAAAAAALKQDTVSTGHVMCFYGVGNHGGGPTRANLESILRAIERRRGPEVQFSSPDRFFVAARQAVEAQNLALPVLHDELQHHARGCYTAISAIKWYNRRCEHALLTAEKLAALAHRLTQAPYPRAALAQAWENVLLNQFHDILPGTSLESAYEDCYEDHRESLWLAAEAQETALAALAEQIDTQGDGRPLLVVNPHPWPQVAPVETAVPVTQSWHDDWSGSYRPGEVDLVDDRGQKVSCQVVALEHDGGRYWMHAAFQADLPALGYRCYHFSFPENAPAWNPPPVGAGSSRPRTPSPTIENEHLRLTVDPHSGWLTGLYDKGLDRGGRGIELLRAPGGVPLAIDDPSDTWSHDVVSFDREVGRFHAQGDVSMVERGPVRQVLRVCSEWGRSQIAIYYTLYAGDPQVYLDLDVDWHEQLTMCKLAFPLALDAPQITSAIPYGHIQRNDDGGEEPCQDWVDVSGTSDGQPAGLAVLNDCKYGYDARDGELRVSLLRSPVYAFHTPRQIESGVVYNYTDQGPQSVRLALLPHAGGWAQSDTVRRALALNAPPIVRELDAHPGPWPATASLVSCTPANVVLTVCKLSEEGDDLILRGYETAGRETQAEIRLGLTGAHCTATWRPHEIKTMRWRPGDPAPIEVNMLEEPLSRTQESA
jgi:alpha-mannosidase